MCQIFNKYAILFNGFMIYIIPYWSNSVEI